MSTNILDESSIFSDGRYISLSVVKNGRGEIEDLADYVRRIRNEKGLSLREVENKSGGAISKGYIGQIENRSVLGQSVTPLKLSALAVGLGVSEDEVFARARGKALSDAESFDGEVAVLFKGINDLSPDDQAEMRAMVRVLAAEVERRRPRRVPSNGKGKR